MIYNRNCYGYAQLLHVYTKNVKTNYAPFIHEFTETELLDLKINLDRQCITDKDMHKHINDWLDVASKQQEYYNKFIKSSDNSKLQQLKNIMNFKDLTSCGLFALFLETYINKTKTNYTAFINIFTDKDIDSIIKQLKSNICPEKSYDIIENWLTEAKKQRSK